MPEPDNRQPTTDNLPAGRPFSSPLARDGGAQTSHDAADSVIADGTVEGHERRILAVLYDMPLGGTASEVAEAVRERWHIKEEILFCKHTVCRRWCGLRDQGLVHVRPDRLATEKARKVDPDARPRFVQRAGEMAHFYGPADEPLLWRLPPPELVAVMAERQAACPRNTRKDAK